MKVQVEFKEPDRKKKIKRILAREGLIFALVIAISILLINSLNIYSFIRFPIGGNDWVDTQWFWLPTTGSIILFGLYPLYLLVRFILWAIKTLKEK